MPVAFIQEFKVDGDDRSTTNYDTVSERLNVEQNPPEGRDPAHRRLRRGGRRLPHLRGVGDPRSV